MVFKICLFINQQLIQEDKGTDYVTGLKPRGEYAPKLKPFHIVFLHSIKLSRYRTKI